MPEGEGGHVLITSRAHADWRVLNAEPVALDVWDRDESREFLGARTGEHDLGVLDQVAEVLGDLPLALEQAAAYANTDGPTVNAQAVDDAIELLLSYGLLTATGDSTLAMHRLVQDVARKTVARRCAWSRPSTRLKCSIGCCPASLASTSSGLRARGCYWSGEFLSSDVGRKPPLRASMVEA